MQIRIKRTFLDGTVQFDRGQLLDLPAELAQKFVDAGDAVPVPRAERAQLHRVPDIAGFVPQKVR